MAFPLPKRATSWSFSRYSLYRQCPLKFKLQNLDKLATGQPKSAALVRGDQIHQLADKYVKGEIARLPAELKLFADLFKESKARLKKTPHLVMAEETLALRSDWSLTTWDDWKGCWVRIKMDYASIVSEDGRPVAIIDDYKTGKFRSDNREEYMEQLELYALGALIKWEKLIPDGLIVRPRLIYLDHGLTYPEPKDAIVYPGSQLPALKKTWAKRVKPLLADTKFAPKPNKFCYNCEYSAGKGGPCKF